MSYFNEIWEREIYGKGNHFNRYPYDSVVSFIYRNYPKEKARREIEILEVGSGAGNNLWFAAREGFSVTGLDGSESAMNYVTKRFEEENLKGKFVVGDFVKLPFENDQFDMVVDRCSLTCVSKRDCAEAVNEIRRVLRDKGKFLFIVYSDFHSSHISGTTLENGHTVEIQQGNLQGVGGISFYSKSDILRMFSKVWNIISIRHRKSEDMSSSKVEVHAEWEIIAEKC